jgi:DSF synthase
MPMPRDFGTYSEVATSFDAAAKAVWLHMRSRPVQCYSPTLLAQLGEIGERVLAMPTGHVRHLVLGSATPGVFNFGGDLALFSLLSKARDRAALVAYAHECLDRVFFLVEAPRHGLVTVALVQGDALGGGLESALATQVVVAERGSQMGFPEVLFNLFPGMGGWQLASRRAGRKAAAELIGSGRVYDAEALFEMGLVDILAAPGQGEAEVRAYLAKQSARAAGLAAAYAAELDAMPVSRARFDQVVERWADTALGIGERDHRLMQKLVRSQLQKSAGFSQTGAVEAIRTENVQSQAAMPVP